MNPTTITAADVCAFLDDHPGVEAQAILSRGRLLQAHEVVYLAGIVREPPVHNVGRRAFAFVRDRILLRWATSVGHPDEAHVGKTPGEGSTSTSGCPAGADGAPDRLGSSFRPAGEASNLPAGSEEIVEWTFTRRRDGRIVMEEP